MKPSLILFLSFAAVLPTDAVPRFAHIFGDHLVLQRDAEIRVWGSGADPGTSLKVRFGASEAPAEIGSDGQWKAQFSPQAAYEKGRELVLSENGNPVATLEDVVVGEVWLASGQSNMQMRVSAMLKGHPESRGWVESADRPDIRLRRINDPVLEKNAAGPSDLSQAGEWTPMTPESVLSFSAVASVFARELGARLKVPIGIIDVSWGGKPIEPFIPRESFTSPLLKNIRDLADEEKLDELAAVRGGVIIRNPEGHPGAIFNARMAPLTAFKVRGFIWYQAESNAGTGEDPREYREKMRALVEGWRDRWSDESLPVYFVQLPSYPPAPGWIRMREEQRRSLAIPNTGMAVTIDIRGEGIHPPDKIAVGKRLALLALRGSYDFKAVVASGPLYLDHQIDGHAIRVRFTHAEDGLMVGNKPDFGSPRETAEAELSWFELAGKDGVWHAAKATIEAREVVVMSDAVSKPVAVRYACDTSPQGGNLYNRVGLPASPFCSDLEKLAWINPPKQRPTTKEKPRD